MVGVYPTWAAYSKSSTQLQEKHPTPREAPKLQEKHPTASNRSTQLPEKHESPVTSFKIIENGDYYIVLLESVNCTNNDELKARERFHIENNVCVNKVIPGRTDKEYYQANKEKIKEKIKEHYQANKEKIKEKIKEYVQANKEKIIEYQKEYRQANKEKIKEKKKEYYQEYRQEQITCECGSTFNRHNKNRHLKTKKHIQYIKDK